MADKKDRPDAAGGFTRRGLIKGLATTAVASATAGAAVLAEERAKSDAAAGGELPVSVTLNGAWLAVPTGFPLLKNCTPDSVPFELAALASSVIVAGATK
jgi:hypothetical protein